MLPILLAAVVAAGILAAPAGAALRVGVGENNYGLFDDARFQRLDIGDVRVVAPFDVIRRGGWARFRLTE